MSRRDQIRMSDEERADFLRHAVKASLCTVDARGFPHVVAMGFAVDGEAIYMTSYAKAQKVRNVERNPKVGILVETGADYAQFRGVMVQGTCELIADPDLAAWVISESATKERPGEPPPAGGLASVGKRVVLKVVPQRWATWDHTKLGGRY